MPHVEVEATFSDFNGGRHLGCQFPTSYAYSFSTVYHHLLGIEVR